MTIKLVVAMVSDDSEAIIKCPQSFTDGVMGSPCPVDKALAWGVEPAPTWARAV